ncbi:RTX family protein [Proteus mirabilis]|uniref:RTX family protein n=1 Tax=Proteus mirabilis TaxID=584 RepID=A0A379FJK9_PROMI|nr:RTX family protein [Proteus mirabilis]
MAISFYGKEKLIALAQKNSLAAAIFYRMMVNEINEGLYWN